MNFLFSCHMQASYRSKTGTQNTSCLYIECDTCTCVCTTCCSVVHDRFVQCCTSHNAIVIDNINN